MSIVFAIRGDSLNARYSSGGKAAGAFGGAVLASDAGALSGSRINLDSGAISTRFAMWQGKNNLPAGKTFSAILRFKTGYTGTPATTCGFFAFGGALMGNAGGLGTIAVQHLSTSGNLTVQVRDENNANSINAGVMVTGWSPTAGTWYDLVVAWDGTATASAFKCWIDASAQTSLTPATAWPTTKTQEYMNQIILGFGYNQSNTRISVDEFVIDNTVIDPTSYGLVGGAGSLNGASRTALIDVASFDGLLYSDPGEANVRLSTGYSYAGASKTGTAAIPTAANVRSGTATDATTGSLAVPSAGDVRSGVSVDAGTGTLVVPTLANTKTGVAGDGGTGTYDGSDRWTDPGEANVRLNTNYKANSTSNNKTGVLDLPPESKVEDGYSYDNGTKTGTLVSTLTVQDIVDGILDAPIADHVQAGSVGKTLKDAKTFALLGGA